MESEGGRSVHPAPSVCAKGVEGVQVGRGAAQVEGTAAQKRKGGEVAHCPSCAPSMHAKWRAWKVRQGGARRGGAGDRTRGRRVHTTPFASSFARRG